MDEEKKDAVVPEEEVTKVEETTSAPIEETTKEEVKEQPAKGEKVEPVTGATSEPKVEKINSKKKGNKGPVIIILVAVVLLLVAAGVYAYMNFFNVKADKVFKTMLEDAKNVYSQNMDIAGAKSIKSEVELDLDVKLPKNTLDEELLDLINDLKLEIGAEIDLDNSNMIYSIAAKMDKDELIDVDAYLTNNKLYAKVHDILDDVVYVDVEELEELDIDFKKMLEDEKMVVDTLFDAISNSLKPEYFTQEKIDSTKVNTLILNDQSLKSIIKDFVGTLKGNEEFLTVLASLSETEVGDLKTGMETLLAEIDDEELLPETSVMEISIYTTGMKYDLERATVKMKTEEQVVMQLTLNPVSEEEISYELAAGEQKITGKIIVKGTAESQDMTVSMQYGSDIELTINTKSKYTLNKESGLSMPKFDDAVNVEDLTQADLTKAMNNLKENDALMEVYNTITDLMGAYDMGSSTDDEYIIFDDEEDKKEETSKDEEKEDEKAEVNQNVVYTKDYKITYKIPTGYVFDDKYSDESYKFFDYDKDNISVSLSISYDTAKEYFEDVNKYDYGYKVGEDETFYSNVVKSDITELKVGKNTFKYVKLTYNAGTASKYEEIFAICELDEKCAYEIEIEARNNKIPDNILKSFATITIE